MQETEAVWPCAEVDSLSLRIIEWTPLHRRKIGRSRKRDVYKRQLYCYWNINQTLFLILKKVILVNSAFTASKILIILFLLYQNLFIYLLVLIPRIRVSIFSKLLINQYIHYGYYYFLQNYKIYKSDNLFVTLLKFFKVLCYFLLRGNLQKLRFDITWGCCCILGTSPVVFYGLSTLFLVYLHRVDF